MTARLWVLAEFVDEVTPPLRDSPSAWIIMVPGDAVALASSDENTAEGESTPRILRDGEIVDFMWFEDHGTAQLILHEDRSWSVDRPKPADATHVRLDYETIGGTLEEAIADHLE